MNNLEKKQYNAIIKIIKKYDLGSNHPPKYWPEIDVSTIEKIIKNVDKNISCDSILAVLDTTLFGRSCKNGIVFTPNGIYNIETFSKPEYANYSNIKSIELVEKKVVMNLQNGSKIINENGVIRNRGNLCNLLTDLVRNSSSIKSKLNNDVHVILPDGTEEWFDDTGKTHDKTKKGERWFDNKGNIIHVKGSDGTEGWFDNKGNMIHGKDSDGTEGWLDDKGNEHRKYSDGTEEWYDVKGNLTRKKQSDGLELWYNSSSAWAYYGKEQDGTEHWYNEETGKEIRRKKIDGTVLWFDSNISKYPIHSKRPDGIEEWYDDSGKITHSKRPDGTEVEFKDGSEYWYDANKNMTYQKESDGNEVWFDYDVNGKLIHSRDSKGLEFDYDSKGIKVHGKLNSTDVWFDAKGEVIIFAKDHGVECWYDSKGNHIYSKFPNDNNWYDINKNKIRRKVAVHCYGCGEIISDQTSICPFCRTEFTDVIYKLLPDGSEVWMTQEGGQFFVVKSDGTMIWLDNNGNTTHRKIPDGTEEWLDIKGHVIHRKKSDGTELWFTIDYDTDGKMVHVVDSNGIEYWYNDKENVDHKKDPDGSESWFDNDGNEVRRKTSDGIDLWFDISISNYPTHSKHPDGTETWYDDNGNITRKKTPDGHEEIFEYQEVKKNQKSSGKYDELEAQNMAAKYGKNATDEDIENVQNNMGKMNKGPLAKVWDKVMTLWTGFNSPDTPASLKAMIIGGLIYMVSPIDLIPDFIPILGLTDDVGVISFVFSQFVRLTAGAAIVAVAAIKLHRLGVEEIRRKLKEQNKDYNYIIVKNIKQYGEEKFEAHVGLYDDDGNEIGEEIFEAPEKDSDIREGMRIYA